jgi:hypothetical protein
MGRTTALRRKIHTPDVMVSKLMTLFIVVEDHWNLGRMGPLPALGLNPASPLGLHENGARCLPPRS